MLNSFGKQNNVLIHKYAFVCAEIMTIFVVGLGGSVVVVEVSKFREV